MVVKIYCVIKDGSFLRGIGEMENLLLYNPFNTQYYLKIYGRTILIMYKSSALLFGPQITTFLYRKYDFVPN